MVLRKKKEKMMLKPYYQTAKGTLYQGDCYELVEDLKIEHPEIKLLLTDPPYELGKLGERKYKRRRNPNGHLRYMGKLEKNNLGSGFDMEILDGFENWFCFCSKAQLIELLLKAQSQNWMLINMIKLNPVPLIAHTYLPDTEYIVHSYSKGRLFGDYEAKRRHIQMIIGGQNAYKGHPTIKPLSVIQKLLTLGSQEGDLIADLFMGSGSTAVACEQMNRKWVGVEKEVKYCRLAVERIEKEVQQTKLF